MQHDYTVMSNIPSAVTVFSMNGRWVHAHACMHAAVPQHALARPAPRAWQMAAMGRDLHSMCLGKRPCMPTNQQAQGVQIYTPLSASIGSVPGGSDYSLFGDTGGVMCCAMRGVI